MSEILHVQSRELTQANLDEIRSLIKQHPTWHRTGLSRELCARWKWVDASGRIKDMACRTLLLKLHRRSLIELPPRQGPSVNHRRSKAFEPILHDTTPLSCSLRELGNLSLRIVDTGPDRVLWQTLMHCYHYLGFTTRVGKSICYLAVDGHERPVGALLFGSAAWTTAARDTFVGWNPQQRKRNLHQVVNNMRFLIPPWVRVRHLASHLLGRTLGRINKDWQHKYAHDIVLVETFVEQARFQGTCYRAANWIHVGQTTGRSRNDTQKQLNVPVKSVFLRPLRRDFRDCLTLETVE